MQDLMGDTEPMKINCISDDAEQDSSNKETESNITQTTEKSSTVSTPKQTLKTNSLSLTPSSNLQKPIQQKVTITKDGKKRVAPQLLSK